jgi:hypothetical protein
MSKRISQFLTLLAISILATTIFLVNHSSGASVSQRASVAGSPTRNAAIVATTAAVLKETSEIRELAILRPVKSGAQSRTEIERMLIKNLDEQMTPAEMRATEIGLRKFGLAPDDFEYRPFIIRLLTEQVAGYYDTKAREFRLADWLELEGQKPVMAHELTHALQDQHFNLRRFEKWPHGDSDAELAAHALIEGDATLAMTIYMAKNPLVALAFSRSLSSADISSEQFNKAPRALRESLVFPYMQGMEWATQVYRKGGWSLVSKAFTELPQSSEQILHAEKYFGHEQPVKVVLPDVASLLNAGKGQQAANSKQQSALGRYQFAAHAIAPEAKDHAGSRVLSARRVPSPTPNAQPPTPSHWRRIDYDVNGEWGYYLILDQFLNSPAESRRAAAGWAGDRYTLYEGPDPGQVFIGQLTVWDTEKDASEFFDAYVKRTALRYPGASLLSDTQGPASDTRRNWQTNEGRVLLELRGLRVLILEGIPEGIDANGLEKALWQ